MGNINKRFGIYNIIKPLGEGGMGEVFLAEDTVLSRKVAIKFLRQSKKNKEIMEQRFLNEAKILASLNHPNIVSIYNFGKEEGLNFIVMEYVEGIPLSTIIKKRLSPYDAWSVLQSVSLGIGAAHDKGILHRDIKPSNIILDKFSNVKIVDFGISKSLVDDSSNLTKIDHFIGTMNYMAPELLKGAAPTVSADMFSIGVVFYEMLFGLNPFSCENKFETIDIIKSTKLSIPSQYEKFLSPELYFVFNKMVAPDPKNRYLSMIDMLTDIAQVDSECLSKNLLPVRQEDGEMTHDFKEVEVNLVRKGLSQSEVVLVFQLAMEIDAGKEDITLNELGEKTLVLSVLSDEKVSDVSLRRAMSLYNSRNNPEKNKVTLSNTMSFSNVALKEKILKQGYVEEATDSPLTAEGANVIVRKSFEQPITISHVVAFRKPKSSLLSYAFLIVGLVLILSFFYKQITAEKEPLSYKKIASELLMFSKRKISKVKNVKVGDEILPAIKEVKESVDERLLSSVEASGFEHRYPPVGSQFQYKIQGYDEQTGKVFENTQQVHTVDFVRGQVAKISFRSNKVNGEMSTVTNQFLPPTKYKDSTGKEVTSKLSGNYGEIFPISKNSKMSFSSVELKKDGSFRNSKQQCSVRGEFLLSVGKGKLNTLKVVCIEQTKGIKGEYIYYYSPKLGIVVKKIDKVTRGDKSLVTKTEMTKYHLAKENKK